MGEHSVSDLIIRKEKAEDQVYYIYVASWKHPLLHVFLLIIIISYELLIIYSGLDTVHTHAYSDDVNNTTTNME